ncbi:MAG: MBL fold metallo-hydrolase, partial [Actinomycetota bacterium]|nr:MBL fold metallo-hydrolase [Actinomycetota bacterium]
MRVAEGVEQFTDQDLVNWFLVETDEGPVAVDAGLPATRKQIGDRAKDLRAIVLTHGHIDHSGFAPAVQREFGTPVYVPEKDVGLVKSPFFYAKSERLPVLYLHHRGAIRTYLRGTLGGGFIAKTVKDATPYREGDDLPGGLRALFTPGHTKGHMALHLPERDIVFAGDAIVTWDPYTDRTGPRLVARCATWNSGLNLETLDK